MQTVKQRQTNATGSMHSADDEVTNLHGRFDLGLRTVTLISTQYNILTYYLYERTVTTVIGIHVRYDTKAI